MRTGTSRRRRSAARRLLGEGELTPFRPFTAAAGRRTALPGDPRALIRAWMRDSGARSARCYWRSAACYRSSAGCYHASATCYRSCANCYRSSASCYWRSAACYRSSASCYHPGAAAGDSKARCYRSRAGCYHSKANCYRSKAGCYHCKARCYCAKADSELPKAFAPERAAPRRKNPQSIRNLRCRRKYPRPE